jgi:hypothetical protein
MSKSKASAIAMRPVKSDAVSHYGYDAANKTLAVQFQNEGGTYHYAGVEHGTVDALLKAPSFGRFLQANIVGKYKHVRQSH